MSGSPRHPDRWLPLIPIGLGLLLVLGASICAGLGRYQLQQTIAIEAWPVIEATVKSCVLGPVRRQGQTRDEQRVWTQFEYAVDGKSYTFTTEENPGWTSLGLKPLPYVTNQKVQISVNPAEPKDAQLFVTPGTRGFWDGMIFVLAGGIGLLALPFFFFGGRSFLRLRREAALKSQLGKGVEVR